MPDEPRCTTPKDLDCVNIDEPNELQYWTEEFGITPEHLCHLVARRGNNVIELRAILEK